MNLNIDGQSVERLSLDFGVTLLTNAASELRIETDFTFWTPDGTALLIDPARPNEALGTLATVLHETVSTATADSATGTLLVEFVHGARIEVRTNDVYESWTFATRGGTKAVGLPGGGISNWDADS